MLSSEKGVRIKGFHHSIESVYPLLWISIIPQVVFLSIEGTPLVYCVLSRHHNQAECYTPYVQQIVGADGVEHDAL